MEEKHAWHSHDTLSASVHSCSTSVYQVCYQAVLCETEKQAIIFESDTAVTVFPRWSILELSALIECSRKFIVYEVAVSCIGRLV